MAPLNPFDSMGFHCSITFKAFIGAIEKRLRGTGVSPSQFLALAHLVALGPQSQTELAERLSISKATGVRLIDRMERDGWVVRKEDPLDGRIKRVIPTHRAIEIWETVSRAGREVLDQAYRGVDVGEIETVKRVLEHMRNNLI